MTCPLSEEQKARVRAAIALVARTPGYGVVGAGLTAHLGQGRIAYDPATPSLPSRMSGAGMVAAALQISTSGPDASCVPRDLW